MDAITAEERGVFPEEVKIVNESYIADCTGGLQPGMEAERPTPQLSGGMGPEIKIRSPPRRGCEVR